MANRYLRKNTLYVEGRDDLFAVAELLKARGFQMDVDPREVHIHQAVLDDKGFGRDQLLKLIGPAVKASTDKAVAFLVDADDSAAGTWESVRARIVSAVGATFTLPAACPADGLVVDVPSLKSRVGVWIMPDNSSAGILEDFLARLVKADDKLLPIATSSTRDAKTAGAAFKPVAESKAVIHAWLAWQAEPGCPFGTAIKARYFDRNAPSADAFVTWVRRLVD